MRVLWFTNDPMPEVNRRLGRPIHGSGHWMSTLLEHLLRLPNMQVEIATAYPGCRNDQFDNKGVTYFVIGQPRTPNIFFSCRNRDLDACVNLVNERAPDLVHIHGTERFYGLMPARRLINYPCLISIQGLMTACRQSFFGSLSPRDIWRSNRLIELGSRRGLLWLYREYTRGTCREQEILAGNQSFIGRTDWDRAHLRAANTMGRYFHVGEIMRDVFTEKRWDLAGCQ